MKVLAPVVAAVDDEELRLAQVREAREHVDKLRVTHARLQRELEQLERNPRKNQLAIERFQLERDAVRLALRLASRKLIRSI
jgi:hypothetical protein